MDNLTSGILGALIGTFISSIVSYYVFKRQSNIESNRIFFQDMFKIIQHIYLAILKGKPVEEDDISYLISFQAVGLREFKEINLKLIEVRKHLISYNEGVQKTLQSTDTSSLQITAKTEAEKEIMNLIQLLRKLS